MKGIGTNRRLRVTFGFFTLIVLLSYGASSVIGDVPLDKGPVAGGNLTLIVIPVAFKDLDSGVSLDQIEHKVFFELNDYFQEVSYGRLRLTGDVAPGWYKLSRPMSWYGVDNERWESLIYDAVRIADHDVNYRDYSFIMIVHAGNDESRSLNTTDITSFGTQGRAVLQTLDGQLPFGVSCLAELDPVGPYAHYLALNLGFPYLHESWWEVGEWDLMAHGFWAADGTSPTHPTSIAKARAGWLGEENIAQVDLNENKTVNLNLLEIQSSGVMAIKIPVSEREYFMIEARAKKGFDEHLPDEGILILHAEGSMNMRKIVYKVIDMNAGTETLDDAVLKPGGWYINQTAQLAVKVNSYQDNAYEVFIDRSENVGEASIQIETGLSGIEITVDEEPLQTDDSGLIQIPLIPGEHRVTVPGEIDYGNKTKAVFQGWSDGTKETERTIQVNTALVFTVSYEKAYLIEVESPYGNVEGEGWHTAFEKAYLKVQREIDGGNGTKQIFKNWSTGDESPELEIIVDQPKEFTVSWDTSYLVSIKVEGLPSGAVVPILVEERTENLTTPHTLEQWISKDKTINVQSVDSLKVGETIFKLNKIIDETGLELKPPLTINKPLKLTIHYTSPNSPGETDSPTSTTDPFPKNEITSPIDAFLKWLFEVASKASETIPF